MSRTRLVLIPPTADSPAPWLTVDADGNVLERGLLTLETPFVGPPVRTVAVAPGADILVRFLDLPNGTFAQTRTAALWSLKDQLAATTDRVRIAVGPAPAEGLRVVAVVGEALLAAWVDWLAGLGLKADVIVPASLTLTEPADDLTLTAVGFGATLALRGRDFAAGVDPDMAEAIAGGRRIEPVREGERIEAMLIAAALNPPVNLLQSAGDQDQDWRRWRLVGGLAAAVLILPVIGAAALAARDDLAARDLRQRSEAAIAAAFTDIPATADPVAEARRRIAMALPAGGAAPAAAALFAAVETVPGAELDSLSADSVGGVRATVSYAAFQDLETLKAGVEATGLTLTDTSTLEDNGRVVSDVMVGAGLPESGS